MLVMNYSSSRDDNAMQVCVCVYAGMILKHFCTAKRNAHEAKRVFKNIVVAL